MNRRLPRWFLFLGVLIFLLLYTSYDYIVTTTIGSNHYISEDFIIGNETGTGFPINHHSSGYEVGSTNIRGHHPENGGSRKVSSYFPQKSYRVSNKEAEILKMTNISTFASEEILEQEPKEKSVLIENYKIIKNRDWRRYGGNNTHTPISRRTDSIKPTTAKHITAKPTTAKPNTVKPTTVKRITAKLTKAKPITAKPTKTHKTTISISPSTRVPPLPSQPSSKGSQYSIGSMISALATKLGVSPSLPPCPEIPIHLRGKINIIKDQVSFSVIEGENPSVTPGGEYRPPHCNTRHHVAVIVPFRARTAQLSIFIRHIHNFLRSQDIHYRIYIINQSDSHPFNRAMLLNVGFTEALKDSNWTCAVFHDVDLLPEDDRNLYSCPEQPRHLSVAVDKFHYTLPYKTLFGGASVIDSDQFRKLNGYSNMFWGWGGEDDDMSKRIKFHKLRIIRYPVEIARYSMIKHQQEKANTMRHGVLSSGHRRYKTDGLNSLVYSVLGKELRPLYTMVNVILNKTEIDNNKDNIVRRSRVVTSKSKNKIKPKEVKNSPVKDGAKKKKEKEDPSFIHPHVAS